MRVFAIGIELARDLGFSGFAGSTICVQGQMTGLFKFLSSQHIDCMVRDGTIRISSLSYFRALEGSKWIADPDEGTITVSADGAVLTSDAIEPQGEPWRPNGYHPMLGARTGGKLIVGNNVRFAYRHPDVFIFCASV
jgi:hypothetical protein